MGLDDLDEKVHDVFISVVREIASGRLRDPECLMSFIYSIARFYTYDQIARRTYRRRVELSLDALVFVGVDPGVDPEQAARRSEGLRIAGKVLQTLGRRDGEILRRFYLKEQGEEQICREMVLTSNQFRLLKSRAKAKFGRVGRAMVRAGPNFPSSGQPAHGTIVP